MPYRCERGQELKPTAQALNGTIDRLKKLEQIEQIYEEWQKILDSLWKQLGYMLKRLLMEVTMAKVLVDGSHF